MKDEQQHGHLSPGNHIPLTHHRGLRGQGDAVFHGMCAGHSPRGAQGRLRAPAAWTAQGEGGRTRFSSLSATQTERGTVKWCLAVCSCVVWCSSGRSWAAQGSAAAGAAPLPQAGSCSVPQQDRGSSRTWTTPRGLLRDRGRVGTASKQQNILNSHRPLHKRHAGCSISVASVTPSGEPAWEMGP